MIPVSQAFHNEAVGQIINPIGSCLISFDKSLSGGRKYFTLGSSTLNGIDLLQGDTDDPIQNWDQYQYVNYADRMVSMEWEREVDFPDAVQSALCDVTFDNTDGFFDPANTASPIAANNVINRPLKLYAGYKNSGVVPQFVGMTDSTPTLDDEKKTATYHAIDFLYAIGQEELTNIVAKKNVRTDQVLDTIFKQFGLNSNQYTLAHGTNTIPFLFFDEGTLAGDVFKQLMQAEYGFLWLDSNGIIQFKPRSYVNPASSYQFTPYSIIKIKPLGSSEIINHVRITSDIREVQEFQEIYHKKNTTSVSDMWTIPANDSATYSASLEDPCYSVVKPTINRASSVSWFTVAKSDQTAVTSGVTCSSVSLTTNSYKMTFKNTNNFNVKITELLLWGQPAKVINQLTLDAKESSSVERYGDQILEINNNPFIQSLDQAQSLAHFILSSRAQYNATLEMDVKGDVSLQLGDAVTIPGEYYGVYVIESMTYQLSGGLLSTHLKLRYSQPLNSFILNQSTLNSEALLV